VLGKALEWTKANPWVPMAFAVGLGLGAVLGGVGFGGRSIVWGTAGEWISGAATVGALAWAIWLFLSERRARLRGYAAAVTVGDPEWVWGQEGGAWSAYARVAVGNDGPAPITRVAVYLNVDGRVEWARKTLIRQSGEWSASVGFIDFGPQRQLDGNVTVVFCDIEQHCWEVRTGEPPMPLKQVPPEASGPDGSSWQR
jgi:hypothetical protein